MPDIRPVFGIEATQTLPSYFCVRTFARCHVLTKYALCNDCHRDLPGIELHEWSAISLHIVEIGYDAPGTIACYKCNKALSVARSGTSCRLCTVKLNEFDQNPASINGLINNLERNLVLRTEEIPQLPNLYR